jgi:hypothetical protein
MVLSPSASMPGRVKLRSGGGLGVAQSFAETLLLEYAQGFFNAEFGSCSATRQ